MSHDFASSGCRLGFQHKAGLLSYWAGLKSNWRAVRCHQGVSGTTAPLRLLFHAGMCCGSWVSKVGKTDDFFSPLESWRSSDHTMKASHSHQQGSFLVSFSSGTLNPVSGVYRVFKNRYLTYTKVHLLGDSKYIWLQSCFHFHKCQIALFWIFSLNIFSSLSQYSQEPFIVCLNIF